MNRQSVFCLMLLLVVCVSGARRGAVEQRGEIRPGENLVVQGLPPIPASLADEVRRYTESRSASWADWHPTERVGRNGTPVWCLLAKDEGHGFRKKENVDFQFYATILWMWSCRGQLPGIR